MSDDGYTLIGHGGIGHDVELFWAEVREYGAWKPDLVATHEVFKQLALDL